MWLTRGTGRAEAQLSIGGGRVSHSQPLYSAFERLPSHTRMAALCARAHTHTLIHTHTHKASLEASHNRASHTHSTHTYMPHTIVPLTLTALTHTCLPQSCLSHSAPTPTCLLHPQPAWRPPCKAPLKRLPSRSSSWTLPPMSLQTYKSRQSSRGQRWRSCTGVCACVYVCVLACMCVCCIFYY